jgi:hypothetical protein
VELLNGRNKRGIYEINKRIGRERDKYRKGRNEKRSAGTNLWPTAREVFKVRFISFLC